MSDKLSDESLPCPFCGCTDISEGEVLTDNPDGGASTQSMCRGCGALGPDAHLREGEVDFGSVKSTAAWNRRASRAPAITMPPLNDAMRAVLTNENCIYGTPDELYAALVKAAPAIPAEPIEKNTPIDELVTSYQQDGFDFEDADRVKAAALRYAESMPDSHARALLFVLASAPAISESEDARDAARYRWLRSEHFPTAANPPLAQVVWKASDNRHTSIWANIIDGDDLDRSIDAARKGEKS